MHLQHTSAQAFKLHLQHLMHLETATDLIEWRHFSSELLLVVVVIEMLHFDSRRFHGLFELSVEADVQSGQVTGWCRSRLVEQLLREHLYLSDERTVDRGRRRKPHAVLQEGSRRYHRDRKLKKLLEELKMHLWVQAQRWNRIWNHLQRDQEAINCNIMSVWLYEWIWLWRVASNSSCLHDKAGVNDGDMLAVNWKSSHPYTLHELVDNFRKVSLNVWLEIKSRAQLQGIGS